MQFKRTIIITITILLSAISLCDVNGKNFGVEKLSEIDSIINDAISKRVTPGCQILIIKNEKTIYDKCFGNFTYEKIQKVTPETMYDLASLSKSTGTLFAIMKLYDSGKIQLTDKASKYLDFLQNTDKENITIQDLLFHETGMPPYMSFGKRSQDISQADINMIANKKIASAKLGNKTYLYSCVNFILLKEVVESICKTSMDVFLNEQYFSPMKLKHIAYLPLLTHNVNEIAPTMKNERLPNGYLQGTVHDPDAAYLGGVSGNAGLFANAADVAAMYQILLNNGSYKDKQYLKPETCKLFTSTTSAGGRRGLGFDKPVPANPTINPCSQNAPSTVFGHTGYTGTCCWVDPTNKLIYVFLSNRTYPDDGENKLSKMSIRPKIQKVIYEHLNEL